MGDWTKRGTTGHYHCTRAEQVGGGHRDDHAGEISRPSVAGRARIWPAKRRRRPPWVTGNFLIFRPFPATPYLLSIIFGPLNSFPYSLFADSAPFERYDKKKLANCWIEFSGHHSNLWTKVRVLMCSWTLGLSIDMWFVNFGRRLVSFPFLGCFG